MSAPRRKKPGRPRRAATASQTLIAFRSTAAEARQLDRDVRAAGCADRAEYLRQLIAAERDRAGMGWRETP